MTDQGCTCQGCGERYRVDLLIPDALWDEIRPAGKAGSPGLLCGSCIMNAIEERGEFDAFELSEIKTFTIRVTDHAP